jgi:hypothetical protein
LGQSCNPHRLGQALCNAVIPTAQGTNPQEWDLFGTPMEDNKLVWPVEPQYRHRLLDRGNLVKFQLVQS